MKHLLQFASVSFCLLTLISCNSDDNTPTHYALPSDSLQAYYPLDSNAVDSSGHSRNGTLYNIRVTSNRFGDSAKACYFSGAGSRIELGTWMNYPYFTLSLWVKPDSSQVQWADIIENNHNNFRAWNIQQVLTTNNYMNFGLKSTDNGTVTGVSDTLKAGIWQHLVVIKDSLHTLMYVDGALIGTGNNVGPTVYDGTEHIGLGRWYNNGFTSRYWRGAMDDVRIYNRPLTLNEVLGLYHERGW